jgi:hypothetical protein
MNVTDAKESRMIDLSILRVHPKTSYSYSPNYDVNIILPLSIIKCTCDYLKYRSNIDKKIVFDIFFFYSFC